MLYLNKYKTIHFERCIENLNFENTKHKIIENLNKH